MASDPHAEFPHNRLKSWLTEAGQEEWVKRISTMSKLGRVLQADCKISVVIPCFNEQEVLPLLFARLGREAQKWGAGYEIILVDDGSRDSTWELLCSQHAADARWKCIRLARNFGHQAALWTGLREATGDVIVVLDADLQDPPEILPQFFTKWEEGYDVVYGVRRKRKENLVKRVSYFVYYRLLALLSEISIPLDSGDFCVMDKDVLAAMKLTREREPFVRGLRAWVGFRQTALVYERDARAAGDVKYTFRKLMALALNGIVSFSSRPLRLATYLGFIVSFFSFVAAVFYFVQRVFPEWFVSLGFRLVPGFATVVVLILFLGGVQLLCVGILGEYIGRIYESVKGRPGATIQNRVGFPGEAGPE
jgi:dolichol-phosphate mannosyltransferase